MRVTIRRTEEGGEGLVLPLPVLTAPVHEDPDGLTEPPQNDVIRIESPMVGRSTGRRSPTQTRSSRRATRSKRQTLCILEAMKLMNEVKAESEGVAPVCAENAAPVQYGDLLFELEPLNGRPLDALMAIPRPVARTPYLLVPLPTTRFLARRNPPRGARECARSRAGRSRKPTAAAGVPPRPDRQPGRGRRSPGPCLP